MFVVFTVISDVCCRGGDRREDEEMVCVCVCVCGGGGGSGLKNSVYLLSN